jgi:hypothetical protein
MTGNGFTKLTTFLCDLERQKIDYGLAHHRDEAMMVMVALPSQRWEIEFFDNGSVEVERFVSAGSIEDEEVFAQLFAAYLEPNHPALVTIGH